MANVDTHRPRSVLFLQPYTTREAYNFGRRLHKFTTCVSSIYLDLKKMSFNYHVPIFVVLSCIVIRARYIVCLFMLHIYTFFPVKAWPSQCYQSSSSQNYFIGFVLFLACVGVYPSRFSSSFFLCSVLLCSYCLSVSLFSFGHRIACPSIRLLLPATLWYLQTFLGWIESHKLYINLLFCSILYTCSS